MRYAVVAICTALLISVFSACMESNSGSTGLSCTGSGSATKEFGTANTCQGVPGDQCLVWPQTFDLTIGGGEGSAFCTTPGTPASLEVTTRFQPEIGWLNEASLVSEAPCDQTHTYQYGYTFLFRGSDFGQFTTPAGPKGTFSLYTFGDLDSQEATAQFCYDTNSSGHYKLYGTDGSTQTGTWCVNCMDDSP